MDSLSRSDPTAKEELCAKVILARGGESEITITNERFNLILGWCYDVEGSVPVGAYAKLKTLARENPGQLQRLCDKACGGLCRNLCFGELISH